MADLGGVPWHCVRPKSEYGVREAPPPGILERPWRCQKNGVKEVERYSKNRNTGNTNLLLILRFDEKSAHYVRLKYSPLSRFLTVTISECNSSEQNIIHFIRKINIDLFKAMLCFYQSSNRFLNFMGTSLQ